MREKFSIRVETNHMEAIRKQFFEVSIDMLCVFSTEGYFVDLNDSCTRILGYTREELLNHHYTEFLCPDDLLATKIISQDVKFGVVLKDFTNRYIHKNGSIVFINWTVQFDRDHQISWCVGRDITNVMRDQAYATRWASLTDMASGVAHEINNPLTIILGRISQLKRKLEKSQNSIEENLADLDKIEATCQRIVKIVGNLQEVAQAPQTKTKLSMPLSEAIAHSLELCRTRFEKNNIRFTTRGNFDVTIFANSVQLSQVFLNILNNAFDAVIGSEEPWVEIVGEVQSEQVWIHISDSGSGILEKHHNQIMHPFFTTKEVGKATGLGLSISKSIIENHQGKLFLNTESAHTTFSIQLPLVKTAANTRELELS